MGYTKKKKKCFTCPDLDSITHQRKYIITGKKPIISEIPIEIDTEPPIEED